MLVVPKVLIQNEAQCLICGDILVSKHSHDYQTCSCGKLSVDGGTFCTRRNFSSKIEFLERSLYLREDKFNSIKEKLTELELAQRSNSGYVNHSLNLLSQHSLLNKPLTEISSNKNLMKQLAATVKGAAKNNKNAYGCFLTIIRALRNEKLLNEPNFR